MSEQHEPVRDPDQPNLPIDDDLEEELEGEDEPDEDETEDAKP